MKYIYLTTFFFFLVLETSAQFDGPQINREGACLGYTLSVNSISYALSSVDGNCWDTNMNGINDPSEDTNSDGIFNSADCAGGIRCWDTNGNGIFDTTEDVNGDGVADIFDCPDCWDTNFNGIEDPIEDVNGDGLFDANDCDPNITPGCSSSPEEDVPAATNYLIEVEPQDGFYDNGVDAVDVILILDWLVDGFPGPREIICADWNGNGTVSTNDIAELITTMLSFTVDNDYQNYYVVPTGFTFPTLDPFNFNPDYGSLEFTDADLVDNILNVEVFKSGDVNSTADFTSDDVVSSRSLTQLNFMDQAVVAGESYEIPFSVLSEGDLRAVTFGLQSEELIFEDFIPTGDNDGFRSNIENYQMAASFISGSAVSEVEFSIKLTALEDGKLGDLISLHPEINNETVDPDYLKSDLTLTSTMTSSVEELESEFSYAPNPVTDQLTLNFGSKKPRLVTMYSVSGHLIAEYKTTEATLEINRESSMASGLYFINVDSQEDSKSYPIIFL